MAAVSRLVIEHQANTGEEPAMGPVGDEGHTIAAQMSQAITEHPAVGGIDAVARILAQASQVSLNTTGGGYMAYVPGGGLFPAAMADLVAGTYNRFTGLAGAAPAFVRFEDDVLRWLAAEFGYGDDARGVFTSGGSQANLSALITARHMRFGDSGDYRRATVYTSAQAHHSIAKSIRLAGVPSTAMREISVDGQLRMCP
ncbi:MAG: pyridoxal-dependent decarboxylase, partial [Myxococcota bacterium]|nr:pyridoxal-dependent decarboxylase [Myxococcota bacterium]